jgi:hypothetical protein
MNEDTQKELMTMTIETFNPEPTFATFEPYHLALGAKANGFYSSPARSGLMTTVLFRKILNSKSRTCFAI